MGVLAMQLRTALLLPTRFTSVLARLNSSGHNRTAPPRRIGRLPLNHVGSVVCYQMTDAKLPGIEGTTFFIVTCSAVPSPQLSSYEAAVVEVLRIRHIEFKLPF
jgi:hypothetical protein